MRRPSIRRALDDLRFGAARTLNLRASLPTAAEARRRAELWLRGKQAEGIREVLVITGRGNQSVGQVSVVREAVRRLLVALSARGVVADYNEHTPGSFAVRLLPLREAVARRSGAPVHADPPVLEPPTLDGLSEPTRQRLRALAAAALDALGVRDPSEAFVRDEMLRQWSALTSALPASIASAVEQERRLAAAIERAIDRIIDDTR